MKRELARGVLLGSLLVATCGCGSDNPVALDFSKREPVSARPANEPKALRIAVGAMISPERTYGAYHGLMSLLARRVGRRALLVQRGTYAEVNRLLLDGDVDVAFICTGAYVAIRDRVQLLAVPVVNGTASYRSLFIARAGSGRSVEALRGARLAFTDVLSNTGSLYPTYYVLHEFGVGPREYFGEITYSGGHDESIALVVAGAVDAAAVDEWVFDAYAREYPTEAARLEVIHRSPAFGAPPVVARASLDPALVTALRGVLLHLGADSASRAVLASIGIERFVPTADYALAIAVAEASRGGAGASGASP